MSEELHTAHLEALLGYNTRRAALHIIGAFMQNMAEFDLRPAEFSVLSLIRHNPGITSAQLCATLGILPPNLVSLVGQLRSGTDTIHNASGEIATGNMDLSH